MSKWREGIREVIDCFSGMKRELFQKKEDEQEKKRHLAEGRVSKDRVQWCTCMIRSLWNSLNPLLCIQMKQWFIRHDRWQWLRISDIMPDFQFDFTTLMLAKYQTIAKILPYLNILICKLRLITISCRVGMWKKQNYQSITSIAYYVMCSEHSAAGHTRS